MDKSASPRHGRGRHRGDSDDEEYTAPRKVTKPRGTTFLKDNNDEENILPRPLPKGITYVSNFTTYNDLMDRNILQVEEDEKVHLSTDEVSAIYHAKCEDQGLSVTWQRESRFMELISKNCKGLNFSLRENGLGGISAQCIAQVLSTNDYYAILDLGGNRLRDTGAEYIAELLKKNDTLVHVALKSNDIGHVGGEALADALKVNNTLTSLDLSGISGINRNHLGTRGAKALSESLKLNNVLCILNLGSNGLGKEGMGLLSQGLVYNKTITELDLSSNNLGWQACKILATVLETANFRVLNLERNYIGDRGCAILATALKVPQRAATLMEDINLSHNLIHPPGIKSFADTIRLSKALKTLKLDGNECGGKVDDHEMGAPRVEASDTGAFEFAMALKENRSLTHLSLNKNDLNKDSGKAFGDALAHNQTLEKLELGDNSIGDEGVMSICGALKKEKCNMRTLDVSNNKIFDKGGLDIALMLRTNTTLQHLDIRQNNIKVAGEPIAEALKSNKTVLSIDFTYNDFSYKSFSSIEASLQRNMKIYKATAGERLMGQISILKHDEELLFLTRDNIEEEIRQREIAKEKVKQKRESLKKTVGGLKANLQELEDELEAKQKERQKEEESNQKLAEELQRYKIKMDKQTTALQRKIEAEADKLAKLTKQIAQTQKAIKHIIDTEEEVFQPILEQLREEEKLRDTAKDDAKWEAEKLVQWELKLKNLERALAGDADEGKKRKKSTPAAEGGKKKEGKKGKGKKK
eukprot:TRINITY_DN66651_c6_g1_i1.p1 TRINITY_DN66651_c6_g1~~TRINITY_DN66651_c6_g1_i1.p1  ORF type:complete len:755 (+),score=93.87 TRINITY_DN66651_c6_g1_i1:80-2344(+)